jgi:antitoxin component YwqK of YwqJK toxin-antitoxin module
MEDIEVFRDAADAADDANVRKGVWKWANLFGEVVPIGNTYSYRRDGMFEKLQRYNVLSAHDSPSTAFHTHGLLLSRYGYNKYGQKHGFWISYNYDGSQHMYGSFKKGRREGAWCVWKTTMDCGRRDKIDVTHVSHYRDGLLDGAHAVYTLDGQLQRACMFYRGQQMVDEWRSEWFRRTELGSILFYDYGPSEEEFERVVKHGAYWNFEYEFFRNVGPLIGVNHIYGEE